MCKKVMYILLMMILLVGCSNTNKVIEDKEEIIANDKELDYELKSDENKIVYKSVDNLYYLIYFNDGDKITDLNWVYFYDDSSDAVKGIDIIKNNVSTKTTVESITNIGKYVVVDFKEDEYKNLTVEHLKKIVTYLEEIK